MGSRALARGGNPPDKSSGAFIATFKRRDEGFRALFVGVGLVVESLGGLGAGVGLSLRAWEGCFLGGTLNRWCRKAFGIGMFRFVARQISKNCRLLILSFQDRPNSMICGAQFAHGCAPGRGSTGFKSFACFRDRRIPLDIQLHREGFGGGSWDTI